MATTDSIYLEEGDVIVIEVTGHQPNQVKEVETVDEDPDGHWKKRIWFVDGSNIRKGRSSGHWGYDSGVHVQALIRYTEIPEEETDRIEYDEEKHCFVYN